MGKLRDYYQVLGVAPRSHFRLIEESYWQKAHQLQKQPTKRAQRKLGQLNEAYEVLGSPHRRAVYDRQFQQRLEEEQPVGPSMLHGLVSLIGKPFRPD